MSMTFAAAAFAAPVHAQFIGYTSPQTVSQTFTFNCDGALHTGTVANLGQAVHFLGYQGSALPANLRVYLSTPSVGVGTIQISDTGTDYNGGILTANGYYSQVQVNAQCTQISGGTTVTLNYFGTSANSVPVTGVQDQSAWFKPVALSSTLSGNPTYPTIIAPYGNSCGQIVVNSSGAAPSGTLTVSTFDNTLGSRTLAAFTLISNTAAQAYNVPCVPTTALQLSISGGGGSGNIFYFFYKPGFLPNLQTPNSGTSSTLPIQVVSDGLSTAFTASVSVINPTLSQQMLTVNAGGGSKSLYFDKIVLSSTVADTVNILVMTGCTTCTSLGTQVNQKIGNSTTSTAAVTTSGGSPTGTTVIFQPNIAANGVVVFDLRGFIAPAGTFAGIYITNGAAVTGSFNAELFWYEK